MSAVQPAVEMNRVLSSLGGSFAIYLSHAMPYFSASDEEFQRAFAALVADRKLYIRKLGEAIGELGARPDIGKFPMVFTDCHDLGSKYLFKELIRHQRNLVELITSVRDRIAPLGRSEWTGLIEESLGNARGHLDTLVQLVARAARPNLTTVG